MSWLNRENLVRVQQTSNIPYVILKKGVFLCCDNFFSEEKMSSEEHNLIFFENKRKLSRKTTYYYKYNTFPIFVPFNRIITLDNIIHDGKIVKRLSYNLGKESKIAMISQDWIDDMDDEQFNDFIDEISTFKYVFIITNNEDDNRVRTIVNILHIGIAIFHNNWYRTVITMLDNMCDNHKRGYCWTSTLPQLDICFYGADQSTLDEVNTVLSNIGVKEFLISWE